MNKQHISEIWPEALRRLQVQHHGDYSGYSAQGIRGGIRILDPRGVEVLRCDVETQARAWARSFKRPASWESLVVAEIERALRRLRPWAEGADNPTPGPTPNERWASSFVNFLGGTK